MKNHKIKLHFGEQNTDNWQKLRLGKFTSSTTFQLFEEPSKQTRTKAAVTQIQNGLWCVNEEILSCRPNNDALNYAGKYLVAAKMCKATEITRSKKVLKEVFKDNALCMDNIDDFGFWNSELLLMSLCYAIDNIDVLAGSSVGLAKKKALEIIHEEQEDDLSHVEAIQWGNDNESVARKFFESKTLNFVDSGHDRIMFVEIEGLESGSSPDDTIEHLVPVEYKCPKNRAIHHDHTKIRSSQDLFNFNKQKWYQVQHQIWSLKSEFGYWSSFDPRLLNSSIAKHKALHTIKIPLDKTVASQFETKIRLATEVRNEFVEEFINSSDKGLY